MKVFLETERLRLREFEPADAEALFALDSNPEVMRFLTGGAPTPLATITGEILPRFVGSYAKFGGLGYWAAESRSARKFVGWFALHPGDPPVEGELEIGYRLRRDQWGRGLATEGARALLTEAFNRGAMRVLAQAYEENLASRRVMEKVGMTFARSFRIESTEELAGDTFDPASAPLFAGEDVEYSIDRATWLEAAVPSRNQ